eukprot:1159634-Pelagomonas_calceolata.AAC.2
MHAKKYLVNASPITDIANDLEEYLAHLNRTAFSFDGGPSLDFAEAALLIQSSACVYSKKRFQASLNECLTLFTQPWSLALGWDTRVWSKYNRGIPSLLSVAPPCQVSAPDLKDEQCYANCVTPLHSLKMPCTLAPLHPQPCALAPSLHALHPYSLVPLHPACMPSPAHLLLRALCIHACMQVEYLHNLAYQALETVRCKKRPADGVEGGPEEGQEGGGPTQVGLRRAKRGAARLRCIGKGRGPWLGAMCEGWA